MLRDLLPREKISHSRMPKDHTSLCVVNTLSKMASGDIHFRGRRACRTITGVTEESVTLKGRSLIKIHLQCGLICQVWPCNNSSPVSATRITKNVIYRDMFKEACGQNVLLMWRQWPFVL